MKVNLYDFDGTIYEGDSSVDFYVFCLKKNIKIIKLLPIFLMYIILYKIKLKTKEQLKEKFFLFVTYFDDIDKLVEEFWNINFSKIKNFYITKEHKNDIIISASPYFLLDFVCKKLGVMNLIASNVDKKSGKYIGKNCSSTQKVKLFKEKYNDVFVEEAYSDSKSDIPMLELAKNSYMVRGNKVIKFK